MKQPTMTNNALAIIAVAFVLFTLGSNYLIYNMINEATGHVVSGEVQFCILPGEATIATLDPVDGGVVSGTYQLNASANHTRGPTFISYVNFSYKYDGNASYAFLGTENSDGDTRFSYLWDTSGLPDISCGVTIKVRPKTNFSGCLITEPNGLKSLDLV